MGNHRVTGGVFGMRCALPTRRWGSIGPPAAWIFHVVNRWCVTRAPDVNRLHRPKELLEDDDDPSAAGDRTSPEILATCPGDHHRTALSSRGGGCGRSRQHQTRVDLVENGRQHGIGGGPALGS